MEWESGGPGMVLGSADPATGTLTVQHASAALADTSWLALGPHALYAISEANGTVSAVDPDTLAVRNTVKTGSGPAHVAVRNYPGEIVVSADGQFVYVSNRGANTVGVFATGDAGASLSPVAAPSGGGDWPRNLVLDPSGARLYVANQNSGTISWLPLSAGLPGAVAGHLAVPGATQIFFA